MTGLFNITTTQDGRQKYSTPSNNTPTSQDAAERLDASVKPASQKLMILECLHKIDRPMLREEILERINYDGVKMKESAACGRLNSLVKDGLVVECEPRVASTKMKCKTYKAVRK